MRVSVCVYLFSESHTRNVGVLLFFSPLVLRALPTLWVEECTRLPINNFPCCAEKILSSVCCFSWTQHGDVGVSTTGTVWPKLISYALYGVHTEFLYQRSLVFTSAFVDLQLDLNDHLYSLFRICNFTLTKKWRLNFYGTPKGPKQTKKNKNKKKKKKNTTAI